MILQNEFLLSAGGHRVTIQGRGVLLVVVSTAEVDIGGPERVVLSDRPLLRDTKFAFSGQEWVVVRESVKQSQGYFRAPVSFATAKKSLSQGLRDVFKIRGPWTLLASGEQLNGTSWPLSGTFLGTLVAPTPGASEPTAPLEPGAIGTFRVNKAVSISSIYTASPVTVPIMDAADSYCCRAIVNLAGLTELRWSASISDPVLPALNSGLFTFSGTIFALLGGNFVAQTTYIPGTLTWILVDFGTDGTDQYLYVNGQTTFTPLSPPNPFTSVNYTFNIGGLATGSPWDGESYLAVGWRPGIITADQHIADAGALGF